MHMELRILRHTYYAPPLGIQPQVYWCIIGPIAIYSLQCMLLAGLLQWWVGHVYSQQITKAYLSQCIYTL